MLFRSDHKFMPNYDSVMEFLEKPIRLEDIERIVSTVQKNGGAG